MSIYTWKCPSCLVQAETLSHAGTVVCERCETHMRRVWGFNIASTMVEHWNPSTGGYVTNRRDFSEQLKRQSEKETEATGLYHDYQPIDIHDQKACGATEEGLDITRKAQRDSGKVAAKKKIII